MISSLKNEHIIMLLSYPIFPKIRYLIFKIYNILFIDNQTFTQSQFNQIKCFKYSNLEKLEPPKRIFQLIKVMEKDKLQSLNQLLLAESSEVTKKACNLGVVIDSSAPYRLENGDYMKKIKIIDDSLNVDKSSFTFKYCFCTIMFFADSPDMLPNPRCLGDIIYLRRFTFQKWNQQFQAKVSIKNISSWILFDGDDDKIQFNEYQKSRADINLQDDKYSHLKIALRDLRKFSRKYMQSHSILKSLSPGVTTKDEDLIVRLNRRQQNGTLILNDGERDISIQDCPTYMMENDIGKLRSIAYVSKVNGINVVCKNNFTSLIKLPQWSFDAQNLIQNSANIKMDVEDIYTPLDDLLNLPINKCSNKIFNIKCEIFSISAANFQAAVKYYDAKKNALHDTMKKETVPVYKIMLLGHDSSLSQKKFAQLWLFSFDGKGGKFLPQVDLNEINELSSMVQEDFLYQKRYNELLQSEHVCMTVQCLTDGKNNKMLRILKI